MRGAVGVAAAIAHHPGPLALTASTLQEQSGGRFSLGVGVSHRELANGLGVPFPDSPVAYMHRWLTELRRRSTDGVAFGGGWPVLLGALGPRMLRLGRPPPMGWCSTGSHPSTPPSRCGPSERDRGGRSPRTVLYVRLMSDDAVRRDALTYGTLENYHRHFVAQGLHGPEAIAAGTTLPLGDIGAARARIDEYRESGLDLLCIYPHTLTSPERAHDLEALARYASHDVALAAFSTARLAGHDHRRELEG